MKPEEEIGHLHPLSHIILRITKIFDEMGFEVAEGPEVESELYSFDALNIPEHHPARDMWDTFWLKPLSDRKLLRPHTSPVQIRYMESHKPPIRIIAPGKCFRHEATDATHEAQFHQVEGLAVAENISVANLKWAMETFLEKLFEKDIGVRLRPSYFPFVEPGFEVDMSCFRCGGNGKKPGSSAESCPTCKGTGWIEIMGAGMVHPKVLENAGIDSKIYSGFAFGAGIDRLAMLKYGIDDIRSLYQADLRVVNQF
jgi:phenylalanyl-tRNA synthetase alpha chain